MAEPTAAVRAGTARQALAPEWPHLRRAAMLSVASGLLWLPLAGFAAMAGCSAQSAQAIRARRASIPCFLVGRLWPAARDESGTGC